MLFWISMKNQQQQQKKVSCRRCRHSPHTALIEVRFTLMMELEVQPSWIQAPDIWITAWSARGVSSASRQKKSSSCLDWKASRSATKRERPSSGPAKLAVEKCAKIVFPSNWQHFFKEQSQKKVVKGEFPHAASTSTFIRNGWNSLQNPMVMQC